MYHVHVVDERSSTVLALDNIVFIIRLIIRTSATKINTCMPLLIVIIIIILLLILYLLQANQRWIRGLKKNERERESLYDTNQHNKF